MNKPLQIGIDPDKDKSGVAIKNGKELQLECLGFYALLERLKMLNKYQDIHVTIEAGHLSKKSCWHSIPPNQRLKMSKEQAARTAENIARKVGENNMVGYLIALYCEEYGIGFTLKRPLQKIWKKGKISHEEFCALTGWDMGPTNQEKRDAALLILDKDIIK